MKKVERLLAEFDRERGLRNKLFVGTESTYHGVGVVAIFSADKSNYRCGNDAGKSRAIGALSAPCL